MSGELIPIRTDEITLKTGDIRTTESVRSYFDGLFAAEKSGEQFPVDLDDVWPFAFTTKTNAIKALRQDATLAEGQDYISFQVEQNSLGRPANQIRMTARCTETVFIKRSPAILDVYLECRRIVWSMAATLSTPPTPVEWARIVLKLDADRQALEGQNKALESKVVQMVNKVQTLDRIAAAEGHVNIQDAARLLQLKQKTFIEWLEAQGWCYRRNGVGPLLAKAEPRAKGFLTVKEMRQDVGGIEKIRVQTLVTPSGLVVLGEKVPGAVKPQPTLFT